MPTERGFTGQPHDASGLVYMNARYYDPAIGQFISPDTVVPDPSVVMAYNRYLYTYGNPLAYVDLSGHIPYPITVRSFAPAQWFGLGFHGDNRGYSCTLNDRAAQIRIPCVGS